MSQYRFRSRPEDHYSGSTAQNDNCLSTASAVDQRIYYEKKKKRCFASQYRFRSRPEDLKLSIMLTKIICLSTASAVDQRISRVWNTLCDFFVSQYRFRSRPEDPQKIFNMFLIFQSYLPFE